MGNSGVAQEKGIRKNLLIGLESWLGDFGEDTGSGENPINISINLIQRESKLKQA